MVRNNRNNGDVRRNSVMVNFCVTALVYHTFLNLEIELYLTTNYRVLCDKELTGEKCQIQ